MSTVLPLFMWGSSSAFNATVKSDGNDRGDNRKEAAKERSQSNRENGHDDVHSGDSVRGNINAKKYNSIESHTEHHACNTRMMRACDE